MTVEEIYALPVNQYGWRVFPTGNWVKLGDGVKLGDRVTLGPWVKLGDGVTLGNWVKLGDGVTLGDGVKLGNRVTLGHGVTLGDDGKEFKWSPLQIQGSRHLLYVAGPNIIGIGCMQKTAAWWNEHYEAVGRKEGYEESQVEEYRRWLDIAIDYQSKLPKVGA
jgi:hypothetical protein